MKKFLIFSLLGAGVVFIVNVLTHKKYAPPVYVEN